MTNIPLEIIEQDFRTPYSLKDTFYSGVLEVGRALGVVAGFSTLEERNETRQKVFRQKIPKYLRRKK